MKTKTQTPPQLPVVDAVLELGRASTISKTRRIRLLRKTIVIMRNSAKRRGDTKTFDALKGNATQQAREIVERAETKEATQ